MATQDYDDNDDLDDDSTDAPNPDDPSNALRNARRAAKGKAKAERERDEAKRELAFLKAGVDTSTPIGNLLMRNYEGDLNPEAIKAEAVAVGALKVEAAEQPPPANSDAPAPSNEPEVTDEERALTAERQSLAGNAPADQLPPASPYATAIKHGRERIAEGESEDRAIAAAIGDLATAALNGDKSVLWSADKQERLARQQG